MINNHWVVLLNTSGVFLMLLVVIGYLVLVEKKREEIVQFFLTIILAGVFAFILKELFDEPRPFVVENTKPLAGLTVLSSFPSFHSALAFSAATKVTFRRRVFGVILIVVAALISLGRVVAKVHYPLDILIGVVIGVCAAGVIEGFWNRRSLDR